MKKDHFAFLVAGLAFGFLLGFGVYHVRFTAPELDAGAQAAGIATPRGPMGPTQVGSGGGGGGGAPMVAEINSLKELLQREPDNLPALVRLGNLHYDVQMWPQAAEYYERAVALDPDDADLMTDLGVCYRGMRKFDRAMELFDRAHDADPAHWQSVFNKVVVAAFDLNRLDEADAAMRELERLNPEAPQVVQLREKLEQMKAGAGEGPS